MRSSDFRERFFRPIELTALGLVVSSLVLMWTLPSLEPMRLKATISLAAIAFYVLFVFRWLLPRYALRDWMHYALLLANLFVVAWAYYLFYPFPLNMVFAVVIAVTGITAGWRMAFAGACLAACADSLVVWLYGDWSSNRLELEAFYFLVFLAVSYLTSSLVGIVRQQHEQAERRNRELALLLETSSTAVLTDLDDLLARLAEKIARELPATFCRIALLDESGDAIVMRGTYPLRPLQGWAPRLGESFALESLPWHRRAIESGEATVWYEDSLRADGGALERDVLFFKGAQSVCLSPLMVGSRAIGVMTLGEARRRQREPCAPEKIALLGALGRQVAMVVRNAQLLQATQRQARRIALLNDVARAISSTIEMDALLELVYRELARTIPTDAYYVGLYDPSDETIDMRILIDDGTRFPPAKIPLGKGLVSWVFREQRPLLIRNLTKELDSLPVQPEPVGADKVPDSWLGVPMAAHARPVGVLVVSAYRPNAFDAEDVALLTNVAEQVVLAVDNANHHAQVEEQSRRDSLTGALNHGLLIARLREEVAAARAEGKSVSLIMLDIDLFKEYNDTYGHVVGDEVLCATVNAILAHVKKTDAVGRWGGEEFAVVLPNATAQQARLVAERIRETMARLSLRGTHGEPVPAPTVSQGIAAFPNHAVDADTLVVIADRMLYRAKAGGRDQVAVA